MIIKPSRTNRRIRDRVKMVGPLVFFFVYICPRTGIINDRNIAKIGLFLLKSESGISEHPYLNNMISNQDYMNYCKQATLFNYSTLGKETYKK